MSTPPHLSLREQLLGCEVISEYANVFHRHGSQGILDTASQQMLDAEFGTHKEEDVVKQILEKGTVQETEV